MTFNVSLGLLILAGLVAITSVRAFGRNDLDVDNYLKPRYPEKHNSLKESFKPRYPQKDNRLKDSLKNWFQRQSCIPLGATGCEANNGKCCRKGNPYTGEMRKCENVGSFSGPVYKCVE